MLNWDLENELQNNGYKIICGCDEAGRGPLAGDVAAAACILPIGIEIKGLNDSKKLSEKKRVSVTTGSVYSFNYVDKITEIPVTHTGYKIEDMAVPFYQIVISGLIPYSSASVNCADESADHFLKSVEYGAYGAYLSGAGPTIMVVAPKGSNVKEKLEELVSTFDHFWLVIPLGVDKNGAEIVK